MAYGKCSKCGWQGPIHKHHIHGRKKSSDTIDLCPNCHALEHDDSGISFKWGVSEWDNLSYWDEGFQKEVWCRMSEVWFGMSFEEFKGEEQNGQPAYS